MNPPSYLHLYKAGLRTLSEAAILWHLAECGVTGSTTPQIIEATGIKKDSIPYILQRLQDMRLIAKPIKTAKPGNPHLWILSRLGYRLITGQTLAIDQSFAPVTATT